VTVAYLAYVVPLAYVGAPEAYATIVAVLVHDVALGETHTPLPTDSPVIFANGIDVALAVTDDVIVVGNIGHVVLPQT
jgi:hypothetical protein